MLRRRRRDVDVDFDDYPDMDIPQQNFAQGHHHHHHVRLLEVVKRNQHRVKGKGKVFPYSLPSVGPGADPGVQAVSPQVT